MFKKIKINTLLLFIPLTTLIFCFNSPKNDNEKMQTIMMSVRNTLSYLHYSPKPINDAYSQDVYNKYFEKIDPFKRYFLKSDMQEFEKHKTKLDDYLNQGDLTFYKLTTDRLYQRMEELDGITQEIFSKPIDLNEDEVLVLEPKDKESPVDKADLAKEWKRYIKYNILQEMEVMSNREERRKKLKDSLIANKLKDTVTLKILSPEEKKIKATEEIKDLMSNMFKRFQKRKKMDWFSVYMNAYTEVFDPHTNYYSPKDKEDFDVQFKGSFIGIGAVIQEKKGGIFLGALTVGAPAWKSKQLTEGDKILKVKPSPNEEAINANGMLVDEIVRYIRGKKDTPVTLTVMKKDGTIKDVTLIRDEVQIEDTFARSLVINTAKGEKVGYIYLPSFNADFGDAKGRNASDDVKAEIAKLKKEGVTRLVLDLRNNGGGSLSEVVDMMGLFMNNGPVVQIKDGNGKIEVYKNKTNAPVWDGPLLIMQNELSASASEILAGAMKAYGRAVIFGSPSSYGKGTVQTFVDLNRFLNTSDDFGALKLTIQKFYGIDGASNQRKGITSDISLKDFFSYAEIGERYQDYALAWDKIGTTDFKPLNQINIAALVKRSQERMANNGTYQLLQESAQWKESLDKEKSITINQTRFNDLMKKRKQEIERFKVLDKYNNGLKFTLHKEEQMRGKTDTTFAHKSDIWLKGLKKDLFLQEGVNVVLDIK
ncbi:tail-specific protease [Riemerella anatipestifer]|uniref:carboxy terminal-processing peptidase n=1 Tax=Riemerella anatipestifer TaxID=34085 RepID=UPI0007EC9F2B|nr:carboxy terminal-processing peptidase [Riemerella anatipestifer]OBP42268.1 tail-specific protease [Riemerella anatipestifer]